jgi:hypothetical protein
MTMTSTQAPSSVEREGGKHELVIRVLAPELDHPIDQPAADAAAAPVALDVHRDIGHVIVGRAWVEAVETGHPTARPPLGLGRRLAIVRRRDRAPSPALAVFLASLADLAARAAKPARRAATEAAPASARPARA